MIIPISFILALLADTIAWQYAPNFSLLVLIYWCMVRPQAVGIGVAFGLGLLQDSLSGVLLGQHAFGFVIIAYLSHQLSPRIRLFPIWQQTLSILMLLTLEQLLYLWIMALTYQPPDTLLYWMPSITGTVLWPILFLLLQQLHHPSKL